MYCPKCGAEFQTEIKRCSDCHVSLVSELKQKSIPEPLEYEEVFTTFNNGDIVFLKSILNDCKIDYQFIGEFFNAARPLLQPARLLVEKSRAGEVREIIKGSDLQVNSVSSSEYTEEEVTTSRRTLLFFGVISLMAIIAFVVVYVKSHRSY